MLHAALRRVTLAGRARAGARAARRSRTRASSNLLDAVVDYLPSPLDIPPVTGIDADTARRDRRARPRDDEPFAALAFKIMNDPSSATLTFFRVYSGKVCRRRRPCSNATQRQARAHRPPPAHAREQARGASRRSTRGNICRGGRPARHAHRRHALRREAPDPARADGSSRSRSSRSPSSRRRRPTSGEARRRARRSSPSRIRRSACTPTPRPARRSSPGWASSTSRSSSTASARVQGRGERRQARRSRTARPSPTAPRPRTSSSAQSGGRGQYGHVVHRRRADRARRAASSSRTTSSAASSRSEFMPADREGRPRGDGARRHRRLPDDRPRGPGSRTAATTRSIRASRPSRSPASHGRSRPRRQARRRPRCSSRS